jgi:predicted nucleotidyltransferase/uncharacterized protein (UPF0332 family)
MEKKEQHSKEHKNVHQEKHQENHKNEEKRENKPAKNKLNPKQFPTLNIISEADIAMDFAKKAYQKFDKLIKSIVLFGSTIKKTNTSASDIDLILIVDDASVKFDSELVAWYREELGKIISANPYQFELHVNTVRLTTWWNDLMRGDPIVMNIIRYGEEVIDFGGFFRPLRILMQEGKIKSTPEAIYTALQRSPMHLLNSRRAELSAIEGIYWAMVDSSQALLIAGKITPPSPEHIAILLKKHFVDNKMLDEKYLSWYSDIYRLYKGIIHGEIHEVKGQNIDLWQERAEKYIGVMAEVIRKIL